MERYVTCEEILITVQLLCFPQLLIAWFVFTFCDRATRSVNQSATASVANGVASSGRIAGSELGGAIPSAEAVVHVAPASGGSSASSDWIAVRALTTLVAARAHARSAIDERIIEDFSRAYANPDEQRYIRFIR